MDSGYHIRVISDIDISDRPPTLVFSWGGNNVRYHARKVITDTIIDKKLSVICQQTLKQMKSANLVSYSPAESVVEGEVGYSSMSGIQDLSLIELVSEGPSLDSIGDDEWSRKFNHYSIVFGPADQPIAIFLKRSSPKLVLRKKDGFFGKVQEGRLVTSDTPSFQLSDGVDLLVVPEKGIFFWQTKEFEMLFKTEQFVQEEVSRWIGEAVSHFPEIKVKIDPSVEATARSQYYTRSRWHAAATLPRSDEEWLAIESAILNRKPDDKLYVGESSTLTLDSNNASEYLALLVEDNFLGEWSKTPYVSLNKRVRQ